ncbi:MAG: iron ABC transporter permease [candidate division NC10 bacterium]|nr:iron ABC transporter permease [candidate division NC10 bacterium]
MAEAAARTGVAAGLAVHRRVDWTPLVWLVNSAILAVLVVAPLVILLYSAFQSPGGFTFRNFVEAFGQAIYQGPIFNSFVYATAVGILSVLIGAPMAWLTGRTDMPGKPLVRTLSIAAFVTPSFLGATAYVILAGPNAGLLNVLYRAVTGSDQPLFNIFSMAGLIYVTSLYTFPVVFIMTGAALTATPGDMEEAARIAGAGRFSVMRTITLPLAMPAIIGAFILTFLEALVLFGAPAMLAIPARFHVMTTQIWAFFHYPPQVEVAAAYAMPMLLVAAVLLWLQRRIMGRRTYTTVGGRAGAPPLVRLGGWRWVGFGGCAVVLLCSIGLPYFALLRAALAKAWGLGWTLQNLTLRNFHYVIFEFDPTRSAIVNTLELATVTATLAAALMGTIAYVAQRRLLTGSRLLGFLATAPIAIPGIVLSIGLFKAYSRPPLLLYGTIWILFVAYLTKYLPVAYTACNAALSTVHPDLEDAARVLGANRLLAFKDVTVPLFGVGLISAWLLVFLPSLRELSASILLFTSRSRVVSVVIYTLYEEGLWESVSALGILLLGITLVLVAVAQRFLGHRFLQI